jgi:hypothetical protein
MDPRINYPLARRFKDCLIPPHLDAFEYQVVGPFANPFALNWVEIPQLAGAQILTATPGQLPTRGQGLHPGDSTSNPEALHGLFHHISIEPLGEVFFVRGTPVPPASLVVGSGNAATTTKARVHLLMGNARERSFDLDIGAGVEFAVKADRVLDVVPLVPDDSGTGALSADSFTAVILTTIYCGQYPTPCCMRQRYTQVFDFSVRAVNSAVMPVMPAARDAELLVDTATLGPGQATMQFIYAFAPEVDATTDPATFTQPPITAAYGTPTYPFVVIGSATIVQGESSTAIVPIPNGANAIIVSNSSGGIASLVQYLNV